MFVLSVFARGCLLRNFCSVVTDCFGRFTSHAQIPGNLRYDKVDNRKRQEERQRVGDKVHEKGDKLIARALHSSALVGVKQWAADNSEYHWRSGATVTAHEVSEHAKADHPEDITQAILNGVCADHG